MPGDSDENFNYCKTWNDELSETPLAAVADQGSHSSSLSEKALQLQEHQYCLPGPAPDSRAALTMNENRRRTTVEPSFITYNHIARYNLQINTREQFCQSFILYHVCIFVPQVLEYQGLTYAG